MTFRFYSKANKNNELKTARNCMELQGWLLILSGIVSTSNLLRALSVQYKNYLLLTAPSKTVIISWLHLVS